MSSRSTIAFAITVVLTTINLEIVNCLQCYQCSHYQCSDPVSSDALSTETCLNLPQSITQIDSSIQTNNITVKINQELASSRLKSSSALTFGCLKLTYKENGASDYTTDRRCTTMTVFGKDVCEFSKNLIELNYGEYVSCSVCDEDLCNSAKKIHQNGVMLIGFIVLTSFVYILY